MRVLWLLAWSAAAWAVPEPFFVHSYHNQLLGELECKFCHVPVKAGSVMLARPGHAQCQACHQPEFAKRNSPLLCAQCHSSGRPGGADVKPVPRAVLSEFSHAQHMDAKRRADAATGFRADCTFCHHASEPALPAHTECAACHAQQVSQGCQKCHNPEEAEAATAKFAPLKDIEFSHRFHFQAKQAPGFDCTTCHAAVVQSASLATLVLPGKQQCLACHQVTMPASHTARWKDDLHGKYAALDRTMCAACHTTDSCNRCHNQLPRSHAPLPLFKNGGHAQLAMLNLRACLTCHTFENTCGGCHTRSLR